MRKPRRPTGGLWSNTDFLKLWSGQSISEFGSQISGLAIPWLAARRPGCDAARVLACSACSASCRSSSSRFPPASGSTGCGAARS